MRIFGGFLFFAGLMLAVRVMLFGVLRRIDKDHVAARRWPLALAAFLTAVGALTYARPVIALGWQLTVLVSGVIAAVGSWRLVTRSAAMSSSDPEDDPRYRFQGHVARVIESLEPHRNALAGRIAFTFDGTKYELAARWASEFSAIVHTGAEVVIERVDNEVAYVEPWAIVEERL